MPAKKESRESKKFSTSEWLRERRRTHDANILRELIAESEVWKSDSSKIDESLFEKTYGLTSIPKTAISPEVLKRKLGIQKIRDEITISMRKIEPQGKTLINQIKSLLPSNLPKREVESISYAFSRIVSERIPKELRWPLVPIGLDTLSAALLNLHIVASTVNQKIPWLLTIWRLEINKVKIATLESILKALSRDAKVAPIIITMREADRSINEALGEDTEIDASPTKDPLSRKITEWIGQISAKKIDLKETKTKIRENVDEIIAELKGNSKNLETKINVQSTPVTNWEILALRSDGPLAHSHEPLLCLMRNEINILRNDVIRNMCINLSSVENFNYPSVTDLQQVSNFAERSAYYEMQRLEPLFNEHYFPNLRKIGLRYRYIFTPRQRPGILSEGLIERMILIEKNIRGCTVHIEPSWSNGPDPRQFPKGSYEAVVEDEIVSLNLNHFDVGSGNWFIETQDMIPRVNPNENLLIKRSTFSDDKDPFKLSKRQVELLGLLWNFQGARSQRRWLLDSVNYPQQTANRTLRAMLENKVLKLLYLPAIEFSGLADGVIVYANCTDIKSRNKFIDYLIESQPFVRILIGDSNDVVAHIRVPLKSSDSVAGNLEEKIPEFSDNFFTTSLRSTMTYKIATVHKLRNPENSKWLDPWKTVS